MTEILPQDKPVVKPKRLNIKHMTELTSIRSGYHDYEVRDVLEVFYQVMREELYKGNSILFERLFRAQIVKPKSRRLYNPRTEKFYTSPAHPKLSVKATIGLIDYIREQEGTTLKVKRGSPNKRLQHHKNSDQGDYYIEKEKLVKQPEFPLPN